MYATNIPTPRCLKGFVGCRDVRNNDPEPLKSIPFHGFFLILGQIPSTHLALSTLLARTAQYPDPCTTGYQEMCAFTTVF